MKALKIAQISSIWERTPPVTYGGTEKIAYDLTEELIKRGHKVTLFATGDSETSGNLKYVLPKAAYRIGIPWNNFLYPLAHITKAFEQADQFDLIHVHLNTRGDYVSLVLSEFVKTPKGFTMQFVFPKPNDKQRADRLMFLHKYRNKNFITISRAQQTLKFLRYVGVVHNGLDFKSYVPSKGPGKYLVWLGRMVHDKGTWEAIQTAKTAKLPIVLAGKVDRFEPLSFEYFEKRVKKHIDGRQVKYIGEVNQQQKRKLLKDAIALLHPINWNEPFGLVTIEAMAMGVPVVAFDRGPVREQIIPGKTGFIVKDIRQMATAVKKVSGLDRTFIHQYALKNFSSAKMAEGYEKIYKNILNQ